MHSPVYPGESDYQGKSGSMLRPRVQRGCPIAFEPSTDFVVTNECLVVPCYERPNAEEEGNKTHIGDDQGRADLPETRSKWLTSVVHIHQMSCP